MDFPSLFWLFHEKIVGKANKSNFFLIFFCHHFELFRLYGDSFFSTGGETLMKNLRGVMFVSLSSLIFSPTNGD